MSDEAYKLLERINQEYHNRLDQDNGIGDPSVFKNQLFVEKYGYSKDLLENLLNELVEHNFIKKWILDAFTLIID